MGINIHYAVYREGTYKPCDNLGWRNSEWFNNLMGRGVQEEYAYLKASPINGADQIFINENNDDYYGFIKYKVADLLEWYEKYKPCEKAGWISVYDNWKLTRKSIIPDEYFLNKPIDNYSSDNWVFATWREPYDMMGAFLRHLIETDIKPEEYIMIYFDC